ncbi:MAG TPA: hypothetical protein VHD63_09380 [Ktedonobacteraceae bacterium]|nr:hypothetical protein [Ktedonobacteraceae bacterium]
MPNERLPQKPVTRTTTRKSSNPTSFTTAQDQTVRDTRYDDEYLLGEDDPYASNPPRPHSSAIRLSPQGPVQRRSRDVNTETQTRRTSSNNIPPRSTQKNNPVQTTGTMPTRSPRNVTTAYDTPLPIRRERRGIHWLLYVGLGMLIALGLWVLGMNALSWGTNEYNTLVYGNPRTFQTDAVVGHNDSSTNPSHFMAINLHGQIIIVEFPGGNPSKAIDYAGPDLIAPGEDQIPVTLTFEDLNHDGKLDMVVHVADKIFVFMNNGTTFAANNNTSPTPTATP